MRALLVDDSRAMRMILRRTLTDLGFEVGEAADGQLALAELERAGPPDLALLDWNMPVMTGYELLLAIRSKPELNRTSIVMVTTESEVSQVQKALDAGANEYLMKPFSDEALREKLLMLGFGAS